MTQAKDRQNNFWQNNAETMGFIIKKSVLYADYRSFDVRRSSASLHETHLIILPSPVLLFVKVRVPSWAIFRLKPRMHADEYRTQ